MGGTFDPIHYGHLVSAGEALTQFRLDHVVFVPNRLSPLKDPADVSDPEHRYLMTFLATVSNPHFSVSRIEIDRPGASYTIDTMRDLAARYPGATLFYITGADAILQILRGEWDQSEELLAMCQFIAATRPGFALTEETLRRTGRGRAPLENVHLMTIPAMAISSTDIRVRVRQGRPATYLVPETVEAYIVKHGLYRRVPTPEVAGG
jgi:nicotinate-nucleotide adenylyltransferase